MKMKYFNAHVGIYDKDNIDIQKNRSGFTMLQSIPTTVSSGNRNGNMKHSDLYVSMEDAMKDYIKPQLKEPEKNMHPNATRHFIVQTLTGDTIEEGVHNFAQLINRYGKESKLQNQSPEKIKADYQVELSIEPVDSYFIDETAERIGDRHTYFIDEIEKFCRDIQDPTMDSSKVLIEFAHSLDSMKIPEKYNDIRTRIRLNVVKIYIEGLKRAYLDQVQELLQSQHTLNIDVEIEAHTGVRFRCPDDGALEIIEENIDHIRSQLQDSFMFNKASYIHSDSKYFVLDAKIDATNLVQLVHSLDKILHAFQLYTKQRNLNYDSGTMMSIENYVLMRAV